MHGDCAHFLSAPTCTGVRTVHALAKNVEHVGAATQQFEQSSFELQGVFSFVVSNTIPGPPAALQLTVAAAHVSVTAAALQQTPLSASRSHFAFVHLAVPSLVSSGKSAGHSSFPAPPAVSCLTKLVEHKGLSSQQSSSLHGDCPQVLVSAAATCVPASHVRVLETLEHWGAGMQQLEQSVFELQSEPFFAGSNTCAGPAQFALAAAHFFGAGTLSLQQEFASVAAQTLVAHKAFASLVRSLSAGQSSALKPSVEAVHVARAVL